MSAFNRRGFIRIAGAGAAASMLPSTLRAQTGARHVVVGGGGFAGATVAKYLRLWSNGAIRVTLVDPSANHISCIMSNLVLEGALSLKDLRFPLSALKKYGVTVIRDRIEEVDSKKKMARLRDGEWMSYDKLVLSGGVSFKRPKGWNPRKSPHAWIAGKQTNLLRDQIKDIPENGVFVLTIPKSPYRCPPGPYERACTVAHILQARNGKVIVLDANSDIQAEKKTFSKAFSTIYKDIIEYHPNAAIRRVDSDSNSVITSVGRFDGHALNIIPEHRASKLVRISGAVPRGQNWAPVNPLSYESNILNDVHIIGDSQATNQPKSGHMANAQAKVCADAIIRNFNGEALDTAERIASITTNSACYSPITSNEASWLTAAFAYDPTKEAMALVPNSLAEAGEWTKENYKDMFTWSENLWADTFR